MSNDRQQAQRRPRIPYTRNEKPARDDNQGKQLFRAVKAIVYNWCATQESGADFMFLQVGTSGVTRIFEHKPNGTPGDRWYCDVLFDNGTKRRIFDPNEIHYTEPQDVDPHAFFGGI